MWESWWNRLRLAWEAGFGADRRHVAGVVSALREATKQRPAHRALNSEERGLITHIERQTQLANRNNITRTKAYLDFYHAHPEVHWSLLAHCVSRNGGWSMTDVQGEWFRHMASKEDSQHFFRFLERANWLIFQDAFPQLVLYQEAKRNGVNLFHLLPVMGVSKFMECIWNLFWKSRNSTLLTRALIINEQNYIESRVVQNPSYQAKVESSVHFHLHSILGLNQVLFPYKQGSTVRLSGTTVGDFTSVDERIRTGLRLYRGLFHDRIHHHAMTTWLDNVPHSASRSDYWPDVFSPEKPTSFEPSYRPRFVGINKPGDSFKPGQKIYSPRLEEVWPDVDHPAAEPGDWFVDLSHAVYLFEAAPREPLDITDQYVQSIRTIETLITAKEKVDNLLPGK